MTQVLRQSTAVDVLIGPFVDLTNAATAEAGESPSVKLSKNGQALAAKNDATTPVHDADGYYNCELDATDTNTVGNMVLTVAASANALPVRHEFQVMEENAYDALYANGADGFGADGVNLATTQSNYAPAKAGDAMDLVANAVDAAAVATGAIDADAIAADAIDLIWDEPLAAHTTADTPGKVINMLTQDTVTLSTDVALDSIVGQMLDAGTSWSYDRTADSLEIISAAAGGDATAANQTTIITHLTDIKGTTFVKDTHSLTDITADVTGLNGDAMRGTDGANTATPLDAAGVRSAVGLAAANLDTQLGDVPTVAEFNARTLAAADYFDPAADTVANVTTVATLTGHTAQTGDSFARIGANGAGLTAVALAAEVRVKKNVALANFTFVMVDTSGDPATGLTVSANRSIDGAAFGACANAVAEISNGAYKINLAQADLNGDTILLRFNATGAKDRFISIVTQTD